MTGPVVLLTARQLADHGHRYRAAAPTARFLAMDPDGTIRDGDRQLAWEEAGATVAFGSTDLFDRLEHGDDAVRHFFGWAVRAEGLTWFHVAAAGVDNPVFGMLLERGVRVTTSHHTAVPISEYVLAQVLRARLALDDMAGDRAQRRWRQREWDEVASSRWLVLGLGAIGTEVARRASAFGARVTGVRRTPRGDEPVDAILSMADVAEAIPDHDVVVACLPSTTETAGLFDAGLLARLAPGTILVNVGRGSLIDEDALRRSLDDGRPATAVLDVVQTEPLPTDHGLWEHPAVVLTCHTAAGGHQRYDRAADLFAENLRRWVDGAPLADEVTPEARDAPT